MSNSYDNFRYLITTHCKGCGNFFSVKTDGDVIRNMECPKCGAVPVVPKTKDSIIERYNQDA